MLHLQAHFYRIRLKFVSQCLIVKLLSFCEAFGIVDVPNGVALADAWHHTITGSGNNSAMPWPVSLKLNVSMCHLQRHMLCTGSTVLLIHTVSSWHTVSEPCQLASINSATATAFPNMRNGARAHSTLLTALIHLLFFVSVSLCGYMRRYMRFVCVSVSIHVFSEADFDA